MQQLTCKMVWPCSFCSLLFSFHLFEVLKRRKKNLILRKSPGGKILKTLKKREDVWKSAKKFGRPPPQKLAEMKF